MEAVTNFLFLGSEITAGFEESYDKPRQYFKSEDITLSIKVHIVKAVVFSVVMYRCEIWIMKKVQLLYVEEVISDAFELWCWRRILRVPWTAR